MAGSPSTFAFFFCLLLLLSSPFAAAQGQPNDVESEDDIVSEVGDGEVGLVAEGIQDILDADLNPAPGVDTVYYFPKNPGKTIAAGEQGDIIGGVSNRGDLSLKVLSVLASLHLPFDYRYHVQNFSALEFPNATVAPSAQASFPYSFTVSKYLQPGSFALVASILYEVDGQPHRSVFYNGTIEVLEASGFLSGETLFLVTLGLGMLGLLSTWMYGQFQKLSKTRRTKKVETGTRSMETVNNEWLQGTSFTQRISKSVAQPTKSKKKK